MANSWSQVDWIAAEALVHLEDALVIGRLAATDKTADFLTTPNGYTVGDTVRIKTRPEYAVKEFDVDGSITRQDIRESTRTMTIEKHYDVSVAVTAKEKVLDLESFSSQVIRPAAYAIAEKCDIFIGQKILDAAGLYASTTLFESASDMALARKAATLQQLDPNRMCLVDLTLESTLLGADYFNTYNNRGGSGETVFNSGSMGFAMGMNFYSSINFPSDSHTYGNGTTSTNNATATDNVIGATALTVDATSNTFQAGDRIAIAGVRRPLKVASQVTAGATSIPLTDPITEVIPDNAAVTVISAGSTGLARGAIFDDRSLGFAMPRLDTPSDKPASVASSNGYSIRVVQGYDMDNKTETLSLDLLLGAVAYDPRRITLLRGDS